MSRRIRLFSLAALVLAAPGLAHERPDTADSSSNCWVAAWKRYQIHPWLLYAMAEQESQLNPRAVNVNSNNSRDVGLMQINSFWFPKLQEYGLSEQSLFDPCTNIQVGAWILAQSIRVYGNTWRAVGAYNAGTGDNEATETRRQQYAERVHRRYLRLAGGGMHDAQSAQP